MPGGRAQASGNTQAITPPEPAQTPMPQFSIGAPPWQGTANAVGVPAVRPYPTTPPPLSAGDLADFGARRRGATRSLQEAMARAGHGRSAADRQLEQASGRLDRERQRTQRATMQGLGGAGVARSARFGGRALADIRDTFADRRAGLESERANQIAALDEMVRESRTARDEELTEIEADKARRRTTLDQLIRQVGA